MTSQTRRLVHSIERATQWDDGTVEVAVVDSYVGRGPAERRAAMLQRNSHPNTTYRVVANERDWFTQHHRKPQ